MPWFNSQPTADQLRWWSVTPEGGGLPISLWPHPGSKRVDSLYRLRFMKDDAIYPSASRFYLVYNSGETSPPGLPPGHSNWGWLDLLPVSEGHLFGEAGDDPDGWNASMDVQEWESLPVAGTPGIQQSYRVTDPDGEWKQFTYENQRDSIGRWYEPHMSSNLLANPPSVETESAGWPFETFEFDWNRTSVPECYDFPFEPGEGFARFNGNDSWIGLTNLTPNVAGTWQWSADVFIRDLRGVWIMAHLTSGTSRTGYNITNGNWVTANVPTTPLPTLNTWFNLKMEREWSVPTGNHMKVFFDDVEVGSLLRPNFQTQFNTLGGNRPGTPPFQFGNFDMRNLLFRIGGPSSPSIILDMPLTDNTCDLGPLANHGIPHNMLLPGCPA